MSVDRWSLCISCDCGADVEQTVELSDGVFTAETILPISSLIPPRERPSNASSTLFVDFFCRRSTDVSVDRRSLPISRDCGPDVEQTVELCDGVDTVVNIQKTS